MDFTDLKSRCQFGFYIQVHANYLSHEKTERGPSVLLIPLSPKISHNWFGKKSEISC